MDIKKEVDRVMSDLKSVSGTNILSSSASSSLYRSLVVIRTTLIKSTDAVKYLLEAGCVRILLSLLSPPPVTSHNKWLKMADIVISILANLCLEEKVRTQVISNNGLSIIVGATVSTDKETIHNRGVRAVANLVEHCPQCDELFSLEFPAFVAKRLMETQEKECQQTYLRAIRLFGQSSSHVRKLIQGSRCVQAVSAILKGGDGKLRTKALRIISQFSSHRCCPGFVEQMLAADCLEELILCCQNPDKDVSFFALSVVFKLCEHGNVRPALGAAGLIPAMMRLLEEEKPHVDQVAVLNVLCLCSKEAVNRHRLYKENTLELFMSALDSRYAAGKFSTLHDRIISILINFLYNDECLAKLLDLGLVELLLIHLRRVCNFHVTEEDLNSQLASVSEESWGRNDGEKVDLGTGDEGLSNLDVCKGGNTNDCLGKADLLVDHSVATAETANDDDELASFSNDLNQVAIDVLEASENDGVERGSASVIGDQQATCRLGELMDDKDQEVLEISMDDTDIAPTLTSDSRKTFSIDSPTYQIEYHSLGLDDSEPGITCKTFSPNHLEDFRTTKSPAELRQSPYSPLSASTSYYSPAHTSPAHSGGSSPKPSSIKSASPSPLGSPEWSHAGSSHFDDSSSSVGQALSPEWQFQSQGSQQGRYSPLIHPYPASPPMAATGGSLLHSQTSIISNRSDDSQQDLFRLSPQPLLTVRPVSEGSGTLSSVVESNPAFVFSASEEEDEIEDQINEDGICQDHPERVGRAEDDGGTKQGHLSPNSSNAHLTQRNLESRKTGKEPKSSSKLYKQARNDISLPPFKRLNSDPGLSSDTKNKFSAETKKSDKDEKKKSESERSPQDLDQPCTSGMCLPGDGEAAQSEKSVLSQQLSFPGYTTKSATLPLPFSHPSLSPLPSASPVREHHNSQYQSPSMSPFSRYSCSPYSSPNPYQSQIQRGGHSLTTQNAGSLQTHQGSSSPHRPVSINTQVKNSHHPESMKGSDALDGQLSTSEVNNDTHAIANENSDRTKKILRTSESNILILLSRISLKTNPTPYLVKHGVLSTLTTYQCVTPKPFQRCVRTLLRVCNNPLCFESLLLEQAPSLIVKNLILEQDGTFPKALFKDIRPLSSCLSRRINFDEMFPSSQSSDTASDFGLKMEFEFGGDAYSRVMASSFGHFSSTTVLNRSLSLDSQCARDNPEVYHTESNDCVEERMRSRVLVGISLLRALSSVTLSKYGQGEIQRVWSRGRQSDKLACAVSLMLLPIGCGPLQRQRVMKDPHVLDRVLPLLFREEAASIRESIVTALSLWAHLMALQPQTPLPLTLEACPDICPDRYLPASQLPAKGADSGEDNRCAKLAKSACSDFSCSILQQKSKGTGGILLQTVASGVNDCTEVKEEVGLNDTSQKQEKALCIYACLCEEYNLNLIVANNRCGERKVFRACKDVLMRKSDVFSAMLSGRYSEADKADIVFSDVSLFGFEYIIHYLHGCEPGCSVIDALSPQSLNFALESDISIAQDVSCSAHQQFTQSVDKEKDADIGQSINMKEDQDVNKDSKLSLKGDVNMEERFRKDINIEHEHSGRVIKERENADTLSNRDVEPKQPVIENAGDVPTQTTLSTQPYHIETSTDMNKDIKMATSSAGMLQAPVISPPSSPSQTDTLGLVSNQSPPTPATIEPEDSSLEHNMDSSTAENRVNQMDDTATKCTEALLDRCIDVLTVADRFLLHKLTAYLSSVLSHHCLCASTSQDVFHLASHYKLDTVLTDAVLAILQSQTSRKDVASLFLHLGTDSGMKDSLMRALKELTTLA